MNVLLEAFGSIVNDDLRQDDMSLEDLMVEALDRVSDVVDFSNVDTVYTGMNADVTFALQDAVEASDIDVDVRAFYPDVSNIAEEDDIEYNEAWKRGYTWRNNQLFVEDSENDQQELVSLVIRVGDAGNNGSALLKQARSKGVTGMDVNMDDLIDRDAAYGGNEQSADADADAEAQA
jgi:hypothetical protein